MLCYGNMRSAPVFSPGCGTVGEFARVRELLASSGFTEAGIAARLELESLAGFESLRAGRQTGRQLTSALDLLIRLFLDEEPVLEEQARAVLPEETLDLLACAGLVTRASGALVAPVAIYPVRGLWIASDRSTHADGHLGPPAADVVYPAREQTGHFLDSLPETSCERLLDLGTGTGVAALDAASRYAARAWAFDITEHSARFAGFNCRFNGLDNVTVGQSDLYHALTGLSFDRIVAHPPYVPVANPTFVFRDGGEDGEQVLRGVIQGLPEFLEPGGCFYGFGMASDREDEALEDRIRKWLGPHVDDFDLLLVATSMRTPAELQSPQGAGERQHWTRVFEKFKVKYLFYGSILAQRHVRPRGRFTVRTLAGTRSGWRETEWLRNWMTTAAGETATDLLLGAKPRQSPRLELRAVHRVRNGRLAPEECTLAVDYPFQTECVCRPWLAQLVSGCDGEVTGGQLLEHCRAQGLLSRDTSENEFTRVLGSMISAGILEIPEFPLPARQTELPPHQ